MKKRNLILLNAVIGLGLFISLTACNGNEKEAPHEITAIKGAKAETFKKEFPTVSMSLEEQIVFSKRDLAEGRGIELNSISVAGARQVNWRSSALGCPKPGMNYTLALVPGVLIQLKVDGEIIAYHARKGGQPFNCPWDRVEAPVYDQDSDLI